MSAVRMAGIPFKDSLLGPKDKITTSSFSLLHYIFTVKQIRLAKKIPCTLQCKGRLWVSKGSTTNKVVNCLAHGRSEEHTSELQSQFHLVCRLLLEKKL